MRVARTQVLQVRDIDPAQRARLEPELVDLFLLSYVFSDTAMFAERVLFRTPDTKLTLLYDRDDNIIGFNTLNIERTECGGRQYAVMHSSVYGHPELRGGGEFAFRRIVIDGLRFKLRHPRVPLCLVGEAVAPAGYARVARHFPLFHPRRGVDIPASITALVSAVMDARGFPRVQDDPWRVELGLPFGIRDGQRMKRHAVSSEHPDIVFFRERNPDFLEGQWLVVYLPLNLEQLHAMMRKSVRARLTRLGLDSVASRQRQ